MHPDVNEVLTPPVLTYVATTVRGRMPTFGEGRPPIVLRWMIRDDMADVLAMEDGPRERRWSEDDYLRVLRLPSGHGLVLVAEMNQKVVGVAACELRDKTLHLLHVAVAPDVRGKGVGSHLVTYLAKQKLEPQTTLFHNEYILKNLGKTLVADVPEDAVAAQRFLKNNGFRATDVRKVGGGTGDTSYLMERDYLSLEEAITSAITNLNQVTGVGWELAKQTPDGKVHSLGSLNCWDSPTTRIGDTTGMMLRTCVPLKHPNVACEALNRLYEGARVLNPEDGSEASKVGIPLAYIDELAVYRGKPGQLAKEFQREPPPQDPPGYDYDADLQRARELFAERERRRKDEAERGRE